MSTFRQLGKGALVYGLQPILTRLVSILMLPVYTRLLTTEDYGVLQLLDTTSDIAAIIFTAGAINGVQRFYFKDADPARQGRLLYTAQVRLLSLGVLACACLLITAPWIQTYALNGSGTASDIRLSALGLATGFLSAVPMLRLQLEQRAAFFTGVSLFRLLVQLSLNILLVAVYRMGVTGVLLSTVITNVALGSALTVNMFRTTGLAWDTEASTALQRFGRPYRLTAMGSYALNFGDRFFLSASRGASEVGIYGLAYQFGFGFSQFTSGPINKAWDPIRYKLANEEPSVRNPVFLRVFDITNVILFAGFVLTACFIRPAIQVLTTPSFYRAAELVPVIVAAYLVQFWTEWFTFQINVSEQTGAYSRATTIAAIVTISLYTALIPAFGMYGAAWATFGGFFFRMLLAYRAAQRLWPIPYNWGPSIKMAIMAGLCAVGASLLQKGQLLEDLLVACGLSLIFVLATAFVAVSTADRETLIAVATRRRSMDSLWS